MATNVVAAFDDRNDGQSAVQELMRNGFKNSEISVVATGSNGEVTQSAVDNEGTLSGEAASAGATSGAVVGGIIGVLAGIGLGFVPFLGFLVAGPLAGLITGAAAGALTGGLLGGLIGLGIPEEHAGVYAESVRRGSTLVTVHANSDTDANRAEQILNQYNPINIEERAAAYRSSGFSNYDPKAPVFTEAEAQAERDRYRAQSAGPVSASNTSLASRRYSSAGNYAYADTPTGVPNSQPGIQTGGHDADGSPDTRGIMEKTADTLTGDDVDDKTGKRVD